VAPAPAPATPATAPGTGDAVTRKQLNRWGCIFLAVFLPVALISLFLILGATGLTIAGIAGWAVLVFLNPWTWGIGSLLSGLLIMSAGFSHRSKGAGSSAWILIVIGAIFCVVGPVIIALAASGQWQGGRSASPSEDLLRPASADVSYTNHGEDERPIFDEWAKKHAAAAERAACEGTNWAHRCRAVAMQVANAGPNAWAVLGVVQVSPNERSPGPERLFAAPLVIKKDGSEILYPPRMSAFGDTESQVQAKIDRALEDARLEASL